MYYPIGLPKKLKVPSKHGSIQAVVCNRDRNLFCVLTESAVWIWYSRPCMPICGLTRSAESLELYGLNVLIEWRPDSSMLLVGTSNGKLLFFNVTVDEKTRQVYVQNDSQTPGLKRDSAELYTKEQIPPLLISQAKVVDVRGGISCIVCLRDELMVSNCTGHIQRLRWDGSLHYDYCIDLSRVPFCDDQLVIQALPLTTPGVYVTCLEYSPLVGGFATVLSDGRAAFLTASTLQFDPNAVQGIWARDLDDATSAAINHKYRLLAYGRANGNGIVYQIDEGTGGLEVTHKLALSSRDYAGNPGPVGFLKWSPDGTVLAMSWANGGFSLWSVFGSLLSTSLKWDYSEDPLSKPLAISCMEWGAEGYEAWCVQRSGNAASKAGAQQGAKSGSLMLNTLPSVSDGCDASEGVQSCPHPSAVVTTSLLLFSFVKSALTVNPSMSHLQRVLLQGSDRLYLSTPEELPLSGASSSTSDDEDPYNVNSFDDDGGTRDYDSESVGDEASGYYYGYNSQPRQQRNDDSEDGTGSFAASYGLPASNKLWLVVPIPYSYTATNYPVRYVCTDSSCSVLAVAGRNGVAHYSLKQRRWHLFGNESQEEDFVVTGGMVWWRGQYLVVGAYNIPANTDELRLYSQHQKLDDQFSTVVKQPAQVLLLNIYSDLLVVLTADCHITVYHLSIPPQSKGGESMVVQVSRVQEVDISGLAVHPACVVSIALTALRTESPRLTPPPPPPPSMRADTTSSDASVGATAASRRYHHSRQHHQYHHHHPPHHNHMHATKHYGPRANRRGQIVGGETNGDHCTSSQSLPPAQSLIFNISGKVLMIQRDKTPPPSVDRAGGSPAQVDDSSQQQPNGKLFQHAQMTPIVLASCCESLWYSNSSSTSLKPHLSHALWLHCGAQGTRAWLPLFPNSSDQSHTFLARRIMLPVMPSIYPLAVLFEEGILVGAETDTSLVGCDSNSLHQPSIIVGRTSQVYLQDILRQLLRRNLGYHAWEVASTCHNLPHFPHALELLLHQVLEEEATSKEPLPDSLLPRVLDFIREFPVHHLQTVVRCARKTELPLWRFLFSVAGNPSALFSQALAERQLDTAASYLIILQNLESSHVSRTHATRLLDATLEAGKWPLCKDLIRFLGAIDPTDLDSPKPSSTQYHSSGGDSAPPKSSGGKRGGGGGGASGGGGAGTGGSGGGSTKVGFSHTSSAQQPAVSPACVDEDLSMIMPSTQLLRRPSGAIIAASQALRGRTYSNTSGSKGVSISPGGGGEGGSANGVASPSTPPSSRQQQRTAQRSASDPKLTRATAGTKEAGRGVRSNSTSSGGKTSDEYFVDTILQRHAKKLLMHGRLYDLGTMTAMLEFPAVSWLTKERCRAARVEDFIAAIKQVHADFSWPYPAVTVNTLRQYSLPERRTEVEDGIRELTLAMHNRVPSLNQGRIGDSGYLSQTTGAGDTQATLTPQHIGGYPPPPPHGTRYSLPDINDVPHQAILIPHTNYTAGDLASVVSGSSSMYGDAPSVYGGGGNGVPSNWADPTRDLLDRSPDPPLQPSPKPPPHALVQLRYLLQLFMEAGCLEWGAVVSVVLRDAFAIVRVVSAAKDAPLPTVIRLTHGLQAFTVFTQSHCLGYQSFMAAIASQVRILEALIRHRDQQPPTTVSSRSSNSVSNTGPLTASSAHHHSLPSNQRALPPDTSSYSQPPVQAQHDSAANNMLVDGSVTSIENSVNSVAERMRSHSDERLNVRRSMSRSSVHSSQTLPSDINEPTSESTGCILS